MSGKGYEKTGDIARDALIDFIKEDIEHGFLPLDEILDECTDCGSTGPCQVGCPNLD